MAIGGGTMSNRASRPDSAAPAVTASHAAIATAVPGTLAGRQRQQTANTTRAMTTAMPPMPQAVMASAAGGVTKNGTRDAGIGADSLPQRRLKAMV